MIMITTFLIVLTFLIFRMNATHQATENSTSHTKAVEEKIVGGARADITHFPYQVSIGYLNTHLRHICGGSILTEKAILTAAHCVGFKVEKLKISAGSSDNINYYNNEGQIQNVKRKIVHPEYTNATYANDIALLILENNLKFNRKVKNISLSKEAISVGKMALVTGWGATAEGGTSNKELQYADAIVLPRDKCRQIYNDRIHSTMFCAGHLAGGRDSCQGDSGGPLVDNQRHQIGIVSWGFGCARKNLPGVYTDVSKYQKWIEENI